METILIATDFSTAARNATIYGFELAKAINAKVVLYTSYQAPTAITDGAVYVTPDDNAKTNFKKLLDEAEMLDPQKRVALTTECHCGPVSDSLLTVAHEKNAAYIIVGMKGYGKEVRRFFGSTVIDLCKRSTIPVIVVPEDATFSIPKNIALASDIADERDVHLLEPLKAIINHFGSELFIVRVIKKHMDETVERLMRSAGLNSFLTGLPHSYEFLKGDNIAKALTTFSENNSVNLIAVIPHEHNLMERFFEKSVTKELVFHSHIPLLILPSYQVKNSSIGHPAFESSQKNTKEALVSLPQL